MIKLILPILAASVLVPVLQTPSDTTFFNMLTQIPFVVAIVWLILKLVDKQTQMLDTITERHEKSIKYIVERFEIMDNRRDNHNQVTVSALLAVLGEVGIKPPTPLSLTHDDNSQDITPRARKKTDHDATVRALRRRQTTQDIILDHLMGDE